MLRIIIAFIFFASGVAISETLRSETQYGAELRNKQESLGSIREDTSSITNAMARAVDKIAFTAHEIAAFVPGTVKPNINMRTIPTGTLTPQGTAGVVDRGIEKKE